MTTDYLTSDHLVSKSLPVFLPEIFLNNVMFSTQRTWIERYWTGKCRVKTLNCHLVEHKARNWENSRRQKLSNLCIFMDPVIMTKDSCRPLGSWRSWVLISTLGNSLDDHQVLLEKVWWFVLSEVKSELPNHGVNISREAVRICWG